MLNILTKLILMCALSLSLNANNHIASLVPNKDAINVQSDIKIQITFNNPIVSTNKNTITLKTDNKNIKGELSVKNINTLVFTPNENLKTGIYSLHVKSLKLINPEQIKPKTWFQKLIYKICSLFYSDVRECKLYILLFGNNDITTSINYFFSVNDNIPTMETLTLETSNTITLTVYKEINGYKLPPQPDETLNNSTLLGIDSNPNGVRDDVERWIKL